MRIQPLIGSTALHSLRLGTDRGNASLGSRVLCRPRIRAEKQGKRQGEKEEKTTTTGKELRRLLFFTSFCSPPPPPPPRTGVMLLNQT